MGLIYPNVSYILKVSVNVAKKIAEEIFNSDSAGVSRPVNITDFYQKQNVCSQLQVVCCDI